MTDPFHDEPGYLTELPEDLKLKRAATARRRRWRRRLALGSLVAVVGAVVALVAVEPRRGGRLGRDAAGGQADGAEGREPRETAPDLPGGLEAASGTGADPRVPRDPAAAPPALLSGAVRPPQGLPRPRCSGSTTTGYEAVTLDQVEDAWYEHGELPAEADRRQLRRRLPEPVRERLPGAAAARLAGRAQPEAAGLRPAGRRRPEDARRRLGARLAHDHARRPDDASTRRSWSARSPARARSCGSASGFRWTTSAIRRAATTTR